MLLADCESRTLDFKNMSDVSGYESFKCPNKMPFNVKPFLNEVKNIQECTRPGCVVYLEFNFKDLPILEAYKLKSSNESFFEDIFTFRINGIMHKEALFNRDLIYIVYGKKLHKSIFSNFFEEKFDSQESEFPKYYFRKGKVGISKYAPILFTPLNFGVKYKMESSNDMQKYAYPPTSRFNFQIEKYYFQFYVPDMLFMSGNEMFEQRFENMLFINETRDAEIEYPISFYANEEYPIRNYPSTQMSMNYGKLPGFQAEQYKPRSTEKLPEPIKPEISSHISSVKISPRANDAKTPTIKLKVGQEYKPKTKNNFGANIIIGRADNVVVNNNYQYSFPLYQYPSAPTFTYPYMPFTAPPPRYPPKSFPDPATVKNRLKALFNENSILPTLDTSETIINTLSKLILPKTTFSTLNEFWSQYKEASESGIELFKNVLNSRIKMSSYTPSLSAYKFHIKAGICEFYENNPYHMRTPFFAKITELAQSEPILQNAKFSDFDKNSWFSILWTPINCTSQLHIVGQFLVFYRITETGCEKIGILCYRLSECEFWKSTLVHENIKEFIKMEREKVINFINENPEAHTFDYNSFINYNK